ncbi:MAG: aminotransferase class III-fold pyridoxal phosphate-dependent enzyme [Planctomycetota bacterium]|nr:aminotransferase class III-fold pyridoxal phosphate-dependent enzyme [Planctomycetota bacterium]
MTPNQSMLWTDRLRNIMPWGSSTISKAPKFAPDEPGAIVRGKGCRVWDADGREYIDFRNALGPVTLGYCFDAVNEAIREQMVNGIVFGQPHPIECLVAEMLCEVIPCAEQARFLKTGGEALAACIRLARHHTGREHVIQIGYNGWLNSLSAAGAVLPGRIGPAAPAGVPESLCMLHHACRWNDLSQMQAIFDRYDDQIAAVVIAADYSKMEDGRTFYPAVRELTRRNGTVLIFDEIVTGFRIAIGGVQEYFGVSPDMAVFAKGMANGMPISVYVGRRELMQDFGDVIVSSTYGGETLSLAAAEAAIRTYRDQDVVGHLWRQGRRLVTEANSLFEQYALGIRLEGMAPCPIFVFEAETGKTDTDRLQDVFFRASYRHGLSFYNVSYVNFSHRDEDITEAMDRLDAACGEIASEGADGCG